MKLHLPKLLRHALLACIAAVPSVVTLSLSTASLVSFASVLAVSQAAAESVTLSTVPAYNGTQGGSYCGVVFTLGAADDARFSVTGGTMTEQVTLTSICLTERGNNDLAADRILYITDANNVYLGSSEVFTKADGSDDAVFAFGGSITLNSGDTYYAYLTSSAGDDTWVVGETSVPAGQYFSGPLAASGGSLTTDSVRNWGLLSGQKATASPAYAPAMRISVDTIAPPPSTLYWEGASGSSWTSNAWSATDGSASTLQAWPSSSAGVSAVLSGAGSLNSSHMIALDSTASLASLTVQNGSYTVSGSGSLNVSGNIVLGEGGNLGIGVATHAAKVEMAGGSNLIVNNELTLAEGGKIEVQGAGAVLHLGQGNGVSASVIDASASGASLKLKGVGTYTLASGSSSLGTNVSLGEEQDWAGTVKVTNVQGDGLNLTNVLNPLGNATSTVEVTGLRGFINTENNADTTASGYTENALTSHIRLTNAADGTAAITIVNGNANASGEGKRRALIQGNLSGAGDIVFQGWNLNRRHATYAIQGDVSQWTGSFINKCQYNGVVHVIMESSTVKSNIKNDTAKGAGNKLHLTFNGASAATMSGVVDVDQLAVNNAVGVSFTNTVKTGTISQSGAASTFSKALTLTGGESTAAALTLNGGLTLGTAAAGSTAAVDATLDVTGELGLNGTLTLNSTGSSITAATLTSTGINVVTTLGTNTLTQTILTLTNAADDVAVTLNGKSGSFMAEDGSASYELKWDSDKKVLSLVTTSLQSSYVGGDANWADTTSWNGGEVPTAELHAKFETAADSTVTLGDNAVAKTVEVDTNAADASVSNTATFQQGTLSTDELTITSGTLEVDSSATVSTKKLMSGTSTAGRLTGKVSITGTGGNYAGGYADAEVQMAGGAQTLAPASGLTVSGASGTATLSYAADATMDAIKTTGANVVLERSNGAALTLEDASSMKGGSLEIKMTPEELASGTAALLKGQKLTLDGTTMVIKGAVDDGSMVLQSVPETLGQSTIETAGPLNVQFDAPVFSKYYSGIQADGNMLRLLRNTSYYSSKLGGLTKNGKAGMNLADAVLVKINPQGAAKAATPALFARARAATAPASGLAKALDELDELVASGNTAAADELGAALAGASTAVLGSAVSSDVERQLKAIRNRTTTMGVDQGVIHHDMPYFNAWINAEGDHRELADNGTESGYKVNSWGGTVGFDVDIAPTFTAGMALTAMYGDLDATGADKASGDVDTYYVSAFARYCASAWTHTFVATAGLADVSLNRTLMGEETKGETDGMSFGLMYEVGRVFALNEDSTACLQPVFNVTWRHTQLDGYTEKGSDLALNVDKQTMDTITFGMGARLQAVVGESMYNRTSIFECRLLAKADVGDRQGSSEVTLAGTTVEVDATEQGAIGLEAGAGLTIPLGDAGASLFMDASVELRADYTKVNGTLGYRVNF